MKIKQGLNRECFCKTCGTVTDSRFRKTMGPMAVVWCILLGLFGGVCCLCFIPYAFDTCKDTTLFCVTCNTAKVTVPANW